jgi:RNA polymerase sigma factor (sigma-70 family)
MSIENLVQEFGAYIYNYALKLSCHPVDAEDIAQETFIQAWKGLDGLQSELAVKKWLAKICYNQFLMKIRSTGRRNEELIEEYDLLEQEGRILIDRFQNPEDEVIVAEEIQALQNGCFLAMVRKLTLNQRIVFSLVDMYGMKVEDAAIVLETSILAAKGLLYRARMNIDSFFADHCNIIDSKNTCSCKAWIEFSQNRDKLQQQTKNLINSLDYREKNYEFRAEVRDKIKTLYSAMPDRKPTEEWYQSVFEALK